MIWREKFTPITNFTLINISYINSRHIHAHFPKIKGDQITMLGDSPATDILGANRQGWRSALIKTGNFHYGADRPECRATETHEDLASFRKQATWMDGTPIQNH